MGSPTQKVWSESAASGEPMLLNQLREYLMEHLKVNGRAGQVADKVRIEARDMTLVVTSYVHYSKRTFKYLTKRFLKQKQLRDHMRVVASNKSSYQVRFFKI